MFSLVSFFAGKGTQTKAELIAQDGEGHASAGYDVLSTECRPSFAGQMACFGISLKYSQLPNASASGLQRLVQVFPGLVNNFQSNGHHAPFVFANSVATELSHILCVLDIIICGKTTVDVDVTSHLSGIFWSAALQLSAYHPALSA